MRGVKKWGIKVRGKWWTMNNKRKDAVYYKKSDAEKDATEWNAMRERGDNPYTVEEYTE